MLRRFSVEAPGLHHRNIPHYTRDAPGLKAFSMTANNGCNQSRRARGPQDSRRDAGATCKPLACSDLGYGNQ